MSGVRRSRTARLSREVRAVDRLVDRGWARWGLLTGWMVVWSVAHLRGRGLGWH